MGLGVPQYEQQIVTILPSVVISVPQVTATVRLGLPSTEDGESFAGVEFHFQITPTEGTVDSGMKIDFFKSYDGVKVDNVIGLAQVIFLAADIGSSGVYHHTLNYETKDIGASVVLVLDDFDGDRTLTAIVYARRWRWKEIIG